MSHEPSHRSKAVYTGFGTLFLASMMLTFGGHFAPTPLIEGLVSIGLIVLIVVFVHMIVRTDQVHERSATRPRCGIIHHRDGHQTQVRFLPTEEEDTYLVRSLDGGQVIMRMGDYLQVDHESPLHEFVFANSPRESTNG